MTEGGALLLAFCCGVGYNWLIEKWGSSQWGNGLTVIWVCIGVAMTLVLSATVKVAAPRLHFYWLGEPLVLTNQQHAAVYELKFFIATGVPMVLGSAWRFIRSVDLPTVDMGREV